MIVQRFAAFSRGDSGGNPAGVVLTQALPSDDLMQRTAADIGYSETVFAARAERGWRVRYFAPAREIPFCGHATIALGVALALAEGDGEFELTLNDGRVTVVGDASGGVLRAELRSPPPRSRPATPALVARALAVFGYRSEDLDMRLPPAVMEAGAAHLLLALRDRTLLERMRYVFEEGRTLMLDAGLATVGLIHAEGSRRFRARHPFAGGGVYEDPATGAAAAAFAGYLRDLAWPHGGQIEILQGVEMGMPCEIVASLTPEVGTPVRVSGMVRRLG
jgi:PhzF family phenazine biosynthesis protein